MLNLIITYKILLIPLAVVITSQIIKMLIEGKKNIFSWQDINKYGGMPSSHSALVCSLVTTIGYTQGLDSPAFAIAFVLAALVIRDATGLRHYLSNHSKIINILITKLPDKEEITLPHMEERLGHTTAQVISGLIFGFGVSLFLLKLL